MELRAIHIFRAPVGGLFRHVCDLARGQGERDVDVGIVCDSSTGGELAESALRSLRPSCDLGLHRISMQRRPGRSDLRVIGQLEQIFRKQSPNILHGHGAKGAAYARLLAPRIGAKAICTPHGGSLHFSYWTPRGAAYLGLERLLKWRTDGSIFESEFARQAYLRKIGSAPFPSRVVHNGLYDYEFDRLPRHDAQYDFVFVGELRRLKGVHVLVDAFARISRQRRVTLLIVGAGAEEARIKSRIRDLGVDKQVDLVPPVRPVTEVLSKGRCIVIPSLAESLPYIVLETIGAGIPLLTTETGGIPEIFGPFADQLVPPGDAAALADAMLGFLQDPGAAYANAERVHAHIRGAFRVSRMVEAVTDFYSEVLALQRRAS